jgi:hypothetical protein
MCATKDPLSESLIDGSKKAQPIINRDIQPTAKNVEKATS